MKWALVLSGGGGNGLAHIGVLKGLKNLGLSPHAVVGTSIGAIIGGVYACGMDIGEIERFVTEDFVMRKYLERVTFQLPDFPLIKFLQAEEAVNALLLNRGVDNGKKILKLLKKLTKNKSYKETMVPFFCNATDLLSGKEVVLKEGSVAEAVRASMAFPGIFTPVERDGMLLVDGYVSNNLPVWIPRKFGIRKVIAVNVSPFVPSRAENLTNGISVLLRAFSAACSSRKPASGNRPNLEILAYEQSMNFNFSKAKELINIGERCVYEEEKRIRRTLFPFLLHPVKRGFLNRFYRQ